MFLIISLIIGVGCAPNSTPSQPAAPQPTITQPTTASTIIIPTPTPTSEPTDTSLPPTDQPEEDAIQIVVPAGSEAVIDGVLSEDEWAPASQIDLDEESQLFLMHAGGYLFLGMRGKPEPVTSICIDQTEQVSILHSSAAIGTSVYQLGDGDGIWEQTRDFEWCCRETTDSPQAQEALSIHLQEEGWVANNGRRGVPEEVEFQIAMPDNSLRLAVNSIGPPYYRSVLTWPGDLQDDCSSLEMITGPIPEQAQFSLEDWVTLSISPD
jgi:hypothetical protein